MRDSWYGWSSCVPQTDPHVKHESQRGGEHRATMTGGGGAVRTDDIYLEMTRTHEVGGDQWRDDDDV